MAEQINTENLEIKVVDSWQLYMHTTFDYKVGDVLCISGKDLSKESFHIYSIEMIQNITGPNGQEPCINLCYLKYLTVRE